jgi:hypothetical protein
MSSLHSQVNELYRGSTELVQHLAYRGSSHRGMGAASHTLKWIWFGHIARYPIGGGGGYFTCSKEDYLF